MHDSEKRGKEGVTDKMQGLKLLYVTSKIDLLCLQKCGYGVVE